MTSSRVTGQRCLGTPHLSVGEDRDMRFLDAAEARILVIERTGSI
ncbi:MAG TPA: hypothetical protein VFJ12_05135 [Segeticoccus sp.]|nr:hypothetical protein [Segeticoccus sp.]